MGTDGLITPSQTIGPFFHPGTAWATKRPSGPPGPSEVLVEGTVIDSEGAAVSDALLEIWQPGAARAQGDAIAAGFQRVATDEQGRFAFLVERAGDDGDGVAHVTLFARGLNGALRTRVYVGISAAELARIPELSRIPPARLATLIPSSLDAGRRVAQWSVRLRGDGETVFFGLTP